MRGRGVMRRGVEIVAIAMMSVAAIQSSFGDTGTEGSQITAEREALRAGVGTPTERRAEVLRLIEAGEKYQSNLTTDEKRAPEAADEAQDVLFELLLNDAALAHVLYGIPLIAERAQVESDVKLLREKVTRALEATGQAIAEVDADEPGKADVDGYRTRINGLITLRDSKLEFFAGMTDVLECMTEDEQAKCAEGAERLGKLKNSLTGRAAVLARLFEGLARAKNGEFDAAEDLFRTAAQDKAASEMDVFCARMNGVLNRRWNKSADEALTGLNSVRSKAQRDHQVFYGLVMAESGCAIRLEKAKSLTGTQAIDGVNAAVVEMTPLIRVLDGDVDAEATSALTEHVLERTGEALQNVNVKEGLLVFARLARAQLQLEAGHASDAEGVVRAVLAEQNLNAEDHGLSLWMLGRIQNREQQAEAAQTYEQLAKAFPRDARAAWAMERSLELLNEQASNGEAAADAAFVGALEFAFEKYGELKGIDRWRLVYADRVIRTGRLDEAERQLEAVAEDSPWLPETWLLRANVLEARANRESDIKTKHVLVRAQIEALGKGQNAIGAAIKSGVSAARGESLAELTLRIQLETVRAQLALGDEQSALEGLKKVNEASGLSEQRRAECAKLKFQALWRSDKKADAAKELTNALKDDSTEARDAALAMIDEVAATLETV
ncbi:MAG TPA: hypothetical protein VG711_01205, partial [Phycisphaerales bacterium]|nr:hypothetical protein [Phycisphaerales bacterium]